MSKLNKKHLWVVTTELTEGSIVYSAFGNRDESRRFKKIAKQLGKTSHAKYKLLKE